MDISELVTPPSPDISLSHADKRSEEIILGKGRGGPVEDVEGKDDKNSRLIEFVIEKVKKELHFDERVAKLLDEKVKDVKAKVNPKIIKELSERIGGKENG